MSAPEQILRHVVLIQFKADASPQQIAEVAAVFRALPARIGAIADLEWGQAVNTPNTFTHCLLTTFRTAADFDDYNNHPAHQALPAQYGHLVQQVAVLDYWIAERPHAHA